MGVSEKNQQAKFYTLSSLGKMRLKIAQENWESMAAAIDQVLQSGA